MTTRPYYFNFFYQRILTSCMGWKDDEFGAFVKLLIHQFDKGYIPDDPEEIGRIITSYKKNWPLLSKKFKNGAQDGELINGFMEEVRTKAFKKSIINGKNGSEGGKAKSKQTLSERLSENVAFAKQTQSNTNLVIGSLVSGCLIEGGTGETKQPIIQAMTDTWMGLKKDYPFDQDTDGHALFDIGEFLAKQLQGKWLPETDIGYLAILESWTRLAKWLVADDFYKSFSLGSVARTKNIQTIWQKSKELKNGTAVKPTASGNRKNAGTEELIASLNQDLGANAG
jgi:hypothetical protein